MATARTSFTSPDVPAARRRATRGSEARGEIAAFIDDDTIVDRNWLAELALAFDLGPRVGCVTQLILPLELDTPAQRWFEEYGGASKGFERRIFDLQAHRPDDPLFPFNAGSFGSGGSMAFDRSVLQSLGGFDPALGNGTPALGGVDIEGFSVSSSKAISCVPTEVDGWHRHRPEYPVLRNRIFAIRCRPNGIPIAIDIARPGLAAAVLRRPGPRALFFALAPAIREAAVEERHLPRELTMAELEECCMGRRICAKPRIFGSHGRIRHLSGERHDDVPCRRQLSGRRPSCRRECGGFSLLQAKAGAGFRGKSWCVQSRASTTGSCRQRLARVPELVGERVLVGGGGDLRPNRVAALFAEVRAWRAARTSCGPWAFLLSPEGNGMAARLCVSRRSRPAADHARHRPDTPPLRDQPSRSGL